MGHNNSSSGTEPAVAGELELSVRETTASRLPFLLRAWWLRQFEQSGDLFWNEACTNTVTLWSTHSDPICDAAGVDREDLL